MFQDAPAPPVATLPEVVVTAARLPPAAGEAAFSVIRRGREDLQGVQRLDEALREIPAVSLFRRTTSLSANPTTQGLSLRAVAPTGAGRALVTLDGAPLNDPFGAWVIWSQVAPESLDGLDVVRGAGGGPYGAGALTGVVALQERSGSGGVLDVSGGEDGAGRIAAAGGGERGRFALTTSASREVSDGYRAVRGPQAGAADVPLDLEATSGAVRLDASLAGGATLSLRASAYEEERGAGLVGARSTATGNALTATLARSPDARRFGWRAQVWRRESDLANSSVAVAAGRTGTTPANDQYETPAEGWGGNLALRRTEVGVLGGRLEWELGGDARRFEGETRERFRYMAGEFTRGRIAGGEASTIGVYAEGAWRRDDWLIAGGLRLDRWASADGRRREWDLATGATTLDETDPDRSGEVVSARLAARREWAGGWSARAAAYSGFRPASLNELHRPFRVGNDLTEANAALEPERLQGVEAEVARSGDGWSLTATAFANRIEDAIVNVTIGQGPGTFPRAGFVPAGGVLRQRANAGTIEATGIEIEAERRWDRLRLQGAISHAWAEMDGGTAVSQLTGLRPAQAPRLSATLAADWTVSDRLTLSARVRHEGRRFDDDLNSRSLEAATTLDGRAEWRLGRGASAWVAADNLTDADVQVFMTGDGVAGLAAPRTIRVGLTFRR